MKLTITANTSKKEVFQEVKFFIESQGFEIVNFDDTRPWGGFFVINESQSSKFIGLFLNDVAEAKLSTSGKISPKILIVESNKRLSWQYHHRRAEVWKVIYGNAGVIISDTDQQTNLQIKMKNDVIVLKQGQRHRLVGNDQWGVIAEIWQHTNVSNPSDEDDIVRVQDDFGR